MAEVKERHEDKESSKRSVLLAHDSSAESHLAINAIESRRDEEDITLVDITQYEGFGPLDYKIPFITTPEGTFQGIDGILAYVRRPERFRRK